MKLCKKCNVSIKTTEEICPLCQNKITGKDEADTYPYIPTIYKKYFTFFRVLLLISVVVSLITIAFDILIKTKYHFSLFVIAFFACLLVILKIALKKRNNVYKFTLWQIINLSILAILWDYFTGWHVWSITYLIPILCIMGSINISILSIVMHDYFDEELFYFICIALIGLVPFIFVITNIVTNTIPSIICIFLNLICFFGLLIFKWKDVKEELIKRMHI